MLKKIDKLIEGKDTGYPKYDAEYQAGVNDAVNIITDFRAAIVEMQNDKLRVGVYFDELLDLIDGGE
jgi:hypothetical protein